MPDDGVKTNYPDFAHSGPGTLAGRFLRRFWQPVMLSRDLPAGRAKPLKILGEQFTAYRGAAGAAHIVAPRCAHRSNPLWTGWVEGDSIRCLYHGWKYDQTGQCTEQPAEDGGGFPERTKLKGYPTREYLGLVFAYFGEEAEPPAFPHFAAFDGPGLIETNAVPRPCNFFNQLENSVDETHFNFVHRKSDFADTGFNDAIPKLSGKETEYGILRHGTRDGKLRISHILMPNVMYALVYSHLMGWTEHIAWRVPHDDDSHITFMVDLVHITEAERPAYEARRDADIAKLKALPDANEIVARILRGEMTLAEVPDRPDLINIQDQVVLSGQGSEVDRSQDMLARSDMQVAILRRIWARELNALQDGKTLKEWTWPADLPLTSGID